MEQTRKQTDIAFTVSGRLAASCAVAYMALPTILFLLGWVRPLFSVPAAAAVAAAAVLLGATIPAPRFISPGARWPFTSASSPFPFCGFWRAE